MLKLFSLISVLLLSISQVHAQHKNNTLNEDQIKALRYVTEIILFPARTPTAWQQIIQLSPKGPLFISHVLNHMVDDHLKWSDKREEKDRLFTLLVKASQDPVAFRSFAANPLRKDIHGKLTWLLDRFQDNPERRERIAKVFDALGLWGREELPFLTERYRDGEWNRFSLAIVSAAGEAGPDELNEFAEVVRELRLQAAHVSSRAFAYSIIYRHGKVPAAEYPEFLRFLIERDLAGEFFAFKQLGFRAGEVTDILWRDTFHDIQYKLVNGDPQWNMAFAMLNRAPSWAGKNLTSDEIQKVRAFLKWIRNNDFDDSCANALMAQSA